MNTKFGIKNLVDAFSLIESNNYRLVLCGTGDAEDYIKEKIATDERIIFVGQVTVEIAREWMQKADILVNPRQNDEEYTKYSFPSKTLEYMLAAKPISNPVIPSLTTIVAYPITST